MKDDIKNIVREQRNILSQFSIEQDRIFNRYIVLGSAASVTLLINMLSKNPTFFENSEYMEWAFWCFSCSIILSAFCLFLNARLSDVAQIKHAELYGFLLGLEKGDDTVNYSDVDQQLINAKLSETHNSFLKWARRIVMSIELSAGLCFCFGIGISMYEIGKLL